MGGLNRGMIETTHKTFSFTRLARFLWAELGLRGCVEPFAVRRHYQLAQIVPAWQIFISAATRHRRGHGYRSSMRSNRLFTALTRSEYDSIAQRTVYHPQSQSDTLASPLHLDLSNAGGAAGLPVSRYGYHPNLKPDPLPLSTTTKLEDSDGSGSRNRWAAAGDLRMPLLTA